MDVQDSEYLLFHAVNFLASHVQYGIVLYFLRRFNYSLDASSEPCIILHLTTILRKSSRLNCNIPYQKVIRTKRKHELNLKKHTACKTDI